jgi:hypothetical protein
MADLSDERLRHGDECLDQFKSPRKSAGSTFTLTEGRAKLLAAKRQAPGHAFAYLVRAGDVLK